MGKPNLGFMKTLIKPAEDEQGRYPKSQKISVYDLVPHEDNFYTLSDIESLEDAIELRHGVKENLIVTPTGDGRYKIISGHRRRQAILNLIGRGVEISDLVPCQVEIFNSKAEEQIAIIIANMATRKLTDWEKIEQYKRLKEPLAEYCKANEIPGRLRDFVAENTGISSAKIAKMENIANNLSPEFKEELKEENINFSTAAELAGLPHEAQTEMHEEHKSTGSITIKDVKKKKEEVYQKNNPESIEAAKYLKSLLRKELKESEDQQKNASNAKARKIYSERAKYLRKYIKLVTGDL
jgi:ParB family transcriptional regulator, chromosome partitioning protein